MARPLRIEYTDAIYHVTVRGNRRGEIFLDDEDRWAWLKVVAQTVVRFQWVIYAYCLMGNHFHLLAQTPHANIARCMRHLNGVYAQRFNKRHGLCGHVLQGRYHAVLVEEENYLLELVRYILLNPVRAGLVQHAADWQWSSYRATCGLQAAPVWLSAGDILRRFSEQPVSAVREFRSFVDAGIAATSPLQHLRQEVFLGNAEFIDFAQSQMLEARRTDIEIPAVQRHDASQLAELFTAADDTAAGAIAAYRSGDYTIRDIADHLGVHYSTISRILTRLL